MLPAAAVLTVLLAGCVIGASSAGSSETTQAADPSRPVEELPTRSPTPTPIPDPDPIRVSGEGSASVDIPNPYFPFAQGRDRLSFDGRFTCDGPGAFHVQLLPESTGVVMGGSGCGGAGGGYQMPIERSQQVYTVEITVEPGTTWTFAGQLSR
ncbi:hypothetical protein SAMN05216554_0517 [Herbiconiux ginsengi]|uniref:Lipoprotein n=2 Tax=Herbiconiux ginsengi TaxID=381665 RepID=A0A1H3KDF1_9MICO|nr:hypothetical protein SAMN05216554_0517 [Herbiconiux ginsengi]